MRCGQVFNGVPILVSKGTVHGPSNVGVSLGLSGVTAR
jgi:hypothetical protein